MSVRTIPRYVNGIQLSEADMTHLKPGGIRLGKPEPCMDLESIKGIPLLNPINDEIVYTQDLWQEKTCLFYFIRSSDCPMCRYVTDEYVRYLDKLRRLNVRVIVIWHQRKKAVDFLNNFFPGGEIYIDKQKRFYRALGGGKKPFLHDLKHRLFYSDFARAQLALRNKTTTFNINNIIYSQFQILAGGMYIIGPKDTGPVLSYLSGNIGDFADIEMAYRVCQELSRTLGLNIKTVKDSDGKASSQQSSTLNLDERMTTKNSSIDCKL